MTGCMRRACLLATIALLAACASQSPRMTAGSDSASAELPAWAAAYDADTRRDLARVREATAAFRDIGAAQRAGYPTAMPACLENATGGMGHHYMKRALLDTVLDVDEPEILLYVPDEHRNPTLVGVEYIVPYSVWSRDRRAPRIFDRDLKRADGLNLWYLHVWTWRENEQGLFADWNPAVECGSGMRASGDARP